MTAICRCSCESRTELSSPPLPEILLISHRQPCLGPMSRSHKLFLAPATLTRSHRDSPEPADPVTSGAASNKAYRCVDFFESASYAA